MHTHPITITIASGKGGTGKTTFSVNLAYALAARGERIRLLDCDVEEPNDHLFVKPHFTETKDVTVLKPVWDAAKCDACGKCARACHYNAIALVKNKVLIFNELCHSCGVCAYVCPHNALTETPAVIGQTQATREGNAPFFFAHGTLNIGEALAPSVVTAVKSYIRTDAVNLLDAAPGTACPVVKALEGADVAVLLTEPTPFGLHDLQLALAMSLKMGIPTGIVVNRSDSKDTIIADFADAAGIPIIGHIPFKREYAATYSSGGVLVEHHPELAANLLDIFARIVELPRTKITAVPDIAAFTVDANETQPFETGRAATYKETTIISGKGGTGKTTVAACFAQLAHDMVLADNDVDAADLHLLLAPRIREVHAFAGGQKAVVNSRKCVGCGQCATSCHFQAIREDGPGNGLMEKTFRPDPLACEGCGLCGLVCPVNAITTEKAVTGAWYVSATDSGPMVHARLGIAEENSGRLVAQVRNRAASLADELHRPGILGDGPPGTGCPVIASVSGADLVLIVTEPTVSGVHDMERVLQLTAHFNVPAAVIINKADLNTDQAARIETLAKKHHARVIGHIPFDRNVHNALMAGKTVIDHGPGPAATAIREAWTGLCGILGTKRAGRQDEQDEHPQIGVRRP